MHYSLVVLSRNRVQETLYYLKFILVLVECPTNEDLSQMATQQFSIAIHYQIRIWHQGKITQVM
jgi:hypothetical protein